MVIICKRNRVNEAAKGQIKPKADWRTIDSFKKGTNKFVFVALKIMRARKPNSFDHFLGESTERQSAYGFIVGTRQEGGVPAPLVLLCTVTKKIFVMG